jgi:hypothetical protein
MAGTVVIEETTIYPLKKIKFSWTSDGAGAADGTTTKEYAGVLERVVQIPNLAGTQPTNLYDCVVNDGDSTDALHANGANLVNTGPTLKSEADGLGAVVASKLTLGITNAGAAKTGVTIVYLR